LRILEEEGSRRADVDLRTKHVFDVLVYVSLMMGLGDVMPEEQEGCCKSRKEKG